jgi:hypothetical protein
MCCRCRLICDSTDSFQQHLKSCLKGDEKIKNSLYHSLSIGKKRNDIMWTKLDVTGKQFSKDSKKRDCERVDSPPTKCVCCD